MVVVPEFLGESVTMVVGMSFCVTPQAGQICDTFDGSSFPQFLQNTISFY
jgi:hypothetical protein